MWFKALIFLFFSAVAHHGLGVKLSPYLEVSAAFLYTQKLSWWTLKMTTKNEIHKTEKDYINAGGWDEKAKFGEFIMK